MHWAHDYKIDKRTGSFTFPNQEPQRSANQADELLAQIPGGRFLAVGHGMTGSSALTAGMIDNINQYATLRGNQAGVMYFMIRSECCGSALLPGGQEIPVSLRPDKTPEDWGLNHREDPEAVNSHEAEAIKELNEELQRDVVRLPASNEKKEAILLPIGTSVSSVLSLCAERGNVCRRSSVPDHEAASPLVVDQYLNGLESAEQSGLHVHVNCGGGKGRTSTFLLIGAMRSDLGSGESIDDFIDRYSGAGKGKEILKEDGERAQRLKDVHAYFQTRKFGIETVPGASEAQNFTEFALISSMSSDFQRDESLEEFIDRYGKIGEAKSALASLGDERTEFLRDFHRSADRTHFH